ncbi:hypothetical protein ACROYT_G038946 [Oculina patagonica]
MQTRHIFALKSKLPYPFTLALPRSTLSYDNVATTTFSLNLTLLRRALRETVVYYRGIRIRVTSNPSSCPSTIIISCLARFKA